MWFYVPTIGSPITGHTTIALPIRSFDGTGVRRDIPLADIAPTMFGHAKDTAEHVRCWGYCDSRSNVDLFSDL